MDLKRREPAKASGKDVEDGASAWFCGDHKLEERTFPHPKKVITSRGRTEV